MLSQYRSPTEVAIGQLSLNRLVTYEEALDIARSLTEKAEVDPSYLGHYNGSEEVFTLWQQSLSPQYYETALEERTKMAIKLSENLYNGSALFRRALTRDHIPRLAVGMRDFLDRTLLHAVALRIGECAQYIFGHPRAKSKGHDDLAGKSG